MLNFKLNNFLNFEFLHQWQLYLETTRELPKYFFIEDPHQTLFVKLGNNKQSVKD